MNEDAIKFWKDAQYSYSQEFAAEQKQYFERKIQISQNTVLAVATILGFSLSLTTVSDAEPGWLLIITWILQILVILAGSILVVIDNECSIEQKTSSFIFNYNMTQINIMDANGEFQDNEEYKTGLLLSAVAEHATLWSYMQATATAKVLELISKYKNKLPSTGLFKKPNKWNTFFFNWMWANSRTVVFFFYLLLTVSFLFLLASVLLNKLH